ncbi:MAG TPA: FAD-dependent oxidoreductase [Edaphobacter sp.]|jgi:glycine/D-amino acid oxidase-like deaminating enzyme|nr:FAD-dependent oxidoreductase [Edaphobacter sp.]
MNPSESSYDVVVVGAGIVGAACAYFLMKEGLRVAVLDRGVVGGEATGAAMGHLVAMNDSPAQFALTKFSLELWRELKDQLPASAEYRQPGTLWIASDDEEMAEVRRKYELYRSAGLACEMLDSAALGEAEPKLRRPLAGALRVLGDGVIYPLAAAQFLLRGVAERGALFTDCNVVSIDRSTVLLGDRTRVSAGYIVNATGCAATGLTPGIAMRKRKGHLILTDRYPGFLRHQVVELGYLKSAHSVSADSVAFNLQPRAAGQILIGSSRQYENEDPAVDDGIVRRIMERACEYMPEVATLSALRIWTGFRAATPDKLPLIGPSPQNPKVLLATGHEGLGITTSLATGRLITDMILQQKSPIAQEPYLPSRMTYEAAHKSGNEPRR